MATYKVGNNDPEMEICRTLGLEPSLVRGLDIHFHVNDVACITVHRYLTKDEAGEIAATISKYEMRLGDEVL